MAGELGVGDFVAEGAEGAGVLGRLDAEEEVRVAAPAAVEEGGLVDDVVAAADGLFGFGGGAAELGEAVFVRAVEGDLRDAAAARLKLGEVALLVLEAAGADDVELGIGAHRAAG